MDLLKERNGGAKKPRRSRRGLCADLNIHSAEEDIAQARRKMWGNFPRDIGCLPFSIRTRPSGIGSTPRISQKRFFARIDSAATGGVPTYISAVSLVEGVYWVERGRIAAAACEGFARELDQERPAFKVIPLDYNVAGALRSVPRDVVPGMPDRLVAATALDLGVPPVTRDRRLQAAGIQTIW